MVRNYFFAALFFLSLSACTAPQKQLDSNPAYSSHHYTSSDMAISWKAEKVDNVLHINGTVTNTRTNYIYDNLEIDATLVDPQGKIIAKQTYNFTPLKLKGTEPFKMAIPLESSMQPERIKFNYRYGIDEDRFSVKFESRL